MNNFFKNEIEPLAKELDTIINEDWFVTKGVKCEICDGEGMILGEDEDGVEIPELCECKLKEIDGMTGHQATIHFDDSVNYEQD